MIRGLMFAASLAALAGCASPMGIAARDAALERGSTVADEALVNAETYICRVSPVGAVMRRYAKPGQAEAWNAICGQESGRIVSE